MSDAAKVVARKVEFRKMRPEDAQAVARLHRDRIDIGFISSLGLRFLTTLYRGIAVSGVATCVVAESDGQVVGFVTIARDVSELYRVVIKANRWRLVLAIVPSLVSWRVWRHCWETFRYPSRNEHADLPPAELLSVSVSQTCSGGGIGKQLVERALEDTWAAGIPAVRVAVGANMPATKFYEATGWAPAGSFINHGRTLNLYIRRRPGN